MGKDLKKYFSGTLELGGPFNRRSVRVSVVSHGGGPDGWVHIAVVPFNGYREWFVSDKPRAFTTSDLVFLCRIRDMVSGRFNSWFEEQLIKEGERICTVNL